GSVSLTGANSSLALSGTNYTVDSSFSISNGQTLSLLGTWTAAPGVTITVNGATFGLGNTTSLGALALTNSTLSVDGNYTTAQVQPLRAGNQLMVGPGGVLDNTGNTLTPNAMTGSLTLAGGILKGGPVNASGGARVMALGSSSVLDGVTLSGDLDMTAAGAFLTGQDGLPLNAPAAIGAASLADPHVPISSLSFSGAQ